MKKIKEEIKKMSKKLGLPKSALRHIFNSGESGYLMGKRLTVRELGAKKVDDIVWFRYKMWDEVGSRINEASKIFSIDKKERRFSFGSGDFVLNAHLGSDDLCEDTENDGEGYLYQAIHIGEKR